MAMFRRRPIKPTHKETEPPNEEPKEGRVLQELSLDEFMKVQIMWVNSIYYLFFIYRYNDIEVIFL